jgi:hypothetical protein
MADEQRSEEVQRWTAKRRAALVVSLLKGETTAAEAVRRHGLKIGEVEDWRDRFLLRAENALRARPKDDEALREEELNRFNRKVGELTMDLDILRTAARLRPTTPGTSDE